MDDPRAENCRVVAVDQAGRVTGVELRVVAQPDTKYALVRVELIDEAAAQGNTVATCIVLDAGGIQTADPVFLAWPFPGLTNHALPGNPNNQHMIANGYTPPEVGPLALYVGDASGKPISDIVGGLGLPWRRHVCFRATWRERGAAEPPADGTVDLAGVLAAINQVEAQIKRLADHLGA